MPAFLGAAGGHPRHANWNFSSTSAGVPSGPMRNEVAAPIVASGFT